MKLSTVTLRPLGRLACSCLVPLSLMFVAFSVPMVVAAEQEASEEKSEKNSHVPEIADDASSAELLQHAKTMMRPPKHVKSRAEMTAFYTEIAEPEMKRVLELVIADSKADVKDVVAAIKLRDQSLMYLVYMRVEDANQRISDFHESLKSDKRAEVVTVVKQIVNAKVLRNWGELDGEAKATFVAELIKEVKSNQITLDSITSLSSTLEVLGRAGDEELAKETREALFPLFRKSDDLRVVEQLDQLELRSFLQAWSEKEQEEKGEFIAKWSAKLKSGPVSKTTARSIQVIFGTLRNDEALASLREVAVVEFKKSDDEKIRAVAERMEGEIRYANLLGSEMKISGKYLDGSDYDKSEYEGKVVLVDFWATWCGPCIGEIPNMLKEYKRYHDKGFEILGISLDSNKQKCIDFCKAKEIPWKSIIGEGDAMGWDQAIARYYAIGGIPSTVIIGKDGKVHSFSGRGPALAKVLQELLGDPIEEEEAEEEMEAAVVE